MVSTKKEINFIESYSCDLDFSFLKNHKEYLVQGVVNTHSGSGVNKTIKDCNIKPETVLEVGVFRNFLCFL